MSYEQAMKDQVCIGDKNPMVWQDDAIALAKQADEEIADAVSILGDFIEIERRDSLTDPDVTATDGFRDETLSKACAIVAKHKGGA